MHGHESVWEYEPPRTQEGAFAAICEEAMARQGLIGETQAETALTQELWPTLSRRQRAIVVSLEAEINRQAHEREAFLMRFIPKSLQQPRIEGAALCSVRGGCGGRVAGAIGHCGDTGGG